MIISNNSVNAFDENPTPIHHKTSQQTRGEGKYLNLMKNIYKTVRSILSNVKRLNSFSQKWRTTNSQSVFNKEQRKFNGKRIVFNKWFWNNWTFITKKQTYIQTSNFSQKLI